MTGNGLAAVMRLEVDLDSCTNLSLDVKFHCWRSIFVGGPACGIWIAQRNGPEKTQEVQRPEALTRP